MKNLSSVFLVPLLLVLLGTRCLAAAFVDAVVAEVNGMVISASDVALARGLGLFGLAPSRGPVDAQDVERFVDAQLILSESRQLGIQETVKDLGESWRNATGQSANDEILDDWLRRNAIDPSWARTLLADHLTWKRFIDLRFQAFTVITDFEIAEALEKQPASKITPQEMRRQLREAEINRRLQKWLSEKREQAQIQRIAHPVGALPNPFPLPVPEGPEQRPLRPLRP